MLLQNAALNKFEVTSRSRKFTLTLTTPLRDLEHVRTNTCGHEVDLYVSQRKNRVGLYCFMLAAETNHTRRKYCIDALDIETKEAAARDEYNDC